MKKNFFSTLKVLFFVGLGVFFIVWFLQKMTSEERTQLWDSFKSANYLWFVVALVINLLSHWLRALRWNLLLEAIEYKPRIGTTFSGVVVGYLANLAIPRLGEVVRCGILNRYEGIPLQKSLGTVVSERVIDMITMVLIIVLALVVEFQVLKNYIFEHLPTNFDTKKLQILLILFVLAILLMVGLFFLFRKKLLKNKLFIRIKQIVLGFWEGIKSVIKLKNPWLFVGYSLGIWICYFFSFYVIFFCFAETSHLSLEAGLMGLVMGSIGVILTPGGIGVYPVLIAEALAIYGVPEITGYAAGWLAWISQQIDVAIVALICLVWLSVSSRKKEKRAIIDTQKS